MNIHVTFKHMDSSPATEEYLTAKLSKLCDKYVSGAAIDATAVFEVAKIRHISNMHLVVNGNTFVATDEADDMQTAVDRMLGKLERQLHDHKAKLRAH